MSLPIYDAYRQVFALSLLSNRVMDMQGAAADLLDQLQLELSAFIHVPAPTPTPLAPSSDFVARYGSWELVWGPAGTTGGSGSGQVLANAVYVAHNPAVVFPEQAQPISVYVVATAATNPASCYDWLIEDAWVKDTVAFADWNPLSPPYAKANKPGVATPLISMGTATGVGKLLALTAPAHAAAAEQSLAGFLSGLSPASGSAICFTGHSLAGALSPTLALYLSMQGKLAAFAQVLVYPSAGATPGNAAFAKLYRKHFPPRVGGQAPYQAWNCNMANRLDIVPHAWAPETLAKIPALYGNSLTDAPSPIMALVASAEANAAAAKTLYTGIENVQLPGQTFSDAPCRVPPGTTEQFLLQAFHQHMTAYWSQPSDQPGLILAEGLPQVQVPLLPGVKRIGESELVAEAARLLAARADRSPA